MDDIKLDVGCGKNCKQGFIGVDAIKLDGVSIICNIDKEKLPFEDSSVSEIYTHMLLEHCVNIVDIMNEFHRVLKNNGKITIIVPYGTTHQFVQDPTHKTPFNEDTFRKYFINKNYVSAFSDYRIKGFFKEVDIHIFGKDINHLQLYAEMETIKNG